MRLKFKIAILLPILLTNVGCSKSDKVTFHTVDFTFDTYYNDTYFLNNNRDVHEGLALASHAMALSTFNGDADYTVRSKYLREYWENIHFDNIWMSDSYYVKPQTNSIAFGIATKHISDFTVVAIAVRGGNYDAEWASNFTIGDTGNAVGFDDASNKVVEGITNYLANYNVQGHIKFWISGYSRAAITSNMTAGKILNKLAANELINPNVTYSAEDFYAYCFEPPMGVQISIDDAHADLYHGIHNFLNYNDFVPLVAPYEWGFVRYGTDHYYPDRINDIYFDETEREKIISLYHFTYGAQNFSDYSVDKWKFFDVGEEKAKENNLPRESVNPSQGRFSRSLIHELATSGFKSRNVYSITIQSGLTELIATMFGVNPQIEKINPSALVEIIFEYDFIKSLILELEQTKSSEFAMDMQMLFLQMFGANEENYDVIEKLYLKCFAFFVLLPESFKVRKDVLAQLLYRDNALGIAIGHMPEVSYSFLCACTSYFMGDKKCKLNDGNYQTLHIENPTSFSLMEKNIKKEIFSFKDGVMSSNHVSAERFADGSIDIYLPNNGAYEYIGICDSISRSANSPLSYDPVYLNALPLQGEF